jgi:hypothetical protein
MHRTEGANNVSGLYSAGPPPTTITADALNSIQEELAAVIEYSGQSMQTAATDTRNQLLAALLALIPTYDAIVVSQASWDAIIERTAANTYQFKDDYKSVFVKIGNYALTLSGGDTWGQLRTNNVSHLEFERGATITFGNTQGYLNVNTSNCFLKNVFVKGLGTVASAVQYSFLLSAAAVTFDNCVVSTRLSNTNMTGFQGSAVAAYNLMAKYINCRATSLKVSSGDVSGFYLCQNISGGTVNNCACTGSGVLYGFSTCDNISSSQAYTLDSVNGNCAGFYTCNQISACTASNIDTSGTGVAYGFNNCNQISGCKVEDIQSAEDVSTYGFYSCDQISSCTASIIDTTGTGNAYGFYSCNQISSCTATDIDSSGNIACGFHNCDQISSCTATDIDAPLATAYGFYYCHYGVALYTTETCAGNAFINANTDEFSCPTGLTP